MEPGTSVEEVCLTAQDLLVEWAGPNDVELEDALGAAEIVWCLMHGLVRLSLLERVEGGQARAKELMHQALKSQLLAWKMTRKKSS